MSVILSILSYVGFTLLYDTFLLNNVFVNNSDQFRTYQRVFLHPVTLLTTLLLTVTALLPDVVAQAAKPVYKDWMRERKRKRANGGSGKSGSTIVPIS